MKSIINQLHKQIDNNISQIRKNLEKDWQTKLCEKRESESCLYIYFNDIKGFKGKSCTKRVKTFIYDLNNKRTSIPLDLYLFFLSYCNGNEVYNDGKLNKTFITDVDINNLENASVSVEEDIIVPIIHDCASMLGVYLYKRKTELSYMVFSLDIEAFQKFETYSFVTKYATFKEAMDHFKDYSIDDYGEWKGFNPSDVQEVPVVFKKYFDYTEEQKSSIIENTLKSATERAISMQI